MRDTPGLSFFQAPLAVGTPDDVVQDLKRYEKRPISIEPGDKRGPRPMPAARSSGMTSPGAAIIP